MVRWVGFDMDLCVGSVMPLMPIVTHLRDSPFGRDWLMKVLYKSERKYTTWFVRPALFTFLNSLACAMDSGLIEGAFLFSNNGSKELVEFMADFFNYCFEPPLQLFQMACYANTPARLPYGIVKNYEVIQKCLAAKGLPLCNSKNDLLFFDDLCHALQQEILHYVQVPAYVYETRKEAVLNMIHPFECVFSVQDWRNIVEQTLEMYEEGNKQKIQPPLEILQDKAMFRNAFAKFRKHRQTRSLKKKIYTIE